MNRSSYTFSKGDNVEVISGNFKGSSGKVLEVLAAQAACPDRRRADDQSHLRKSQDRPQGTIAEREGPIHISNVKVLERGEKAGKGKGAKKKATKEKPEEAKKEKA